MRQAGRVFLTGHYMKSKKRGNPDDTALPPSERPGCTSPTSRTGWGKNKCKLKLATKDGQWRREHATGNRASLTLTGQSRFHHHHVIWLTLASKRRRSPPIIPRVCLASRRNAVLQANFHLKHPFVTFKKQEQCNSFLYSRLNKYQRRNVTQKRTTGMMS